MTTSTTRSTTSHLPRHAFRVALASALAALAGCASAVEQREQGEIDAQAQALRPAPEVPAVLTVPAGNRLAFYLDATGQQVYVCQQTATGHGFVLQAPDADLYKPNGRIAGSHYAGPTWEALDGSTVVAARVDGVTPDPSAIAWLLLSAVSHTGQGKMSKVSFIQRLDTTGGLAPTTGCDADHVGLIQGVDYTARYYFYEPTPSCQH
jgi:hypothetical protein